MDMLQFVDSTTQYKDIEYEVADWVARITLNRPERYNAYSTRALVELAHAFRSASFDDNVAVIVYTGAGDRAFCTGGDVKEYEANYTSAPRDYWKYMTLFGGYIESILNTGKPVIARLNGMAVGGGNESQLACDLSVIAEHAFIKQVGTSVGSVAAGGSTQWLPLFVGDRRARYILMTNRVVPAYQALEWGLVSEVAPSVKKALCQELILKFPECMRYTKQQVNFWKDLAWHQTIGHARDWLSIHYSSWEPLEGMRAFVEKRPPDYMKLRESAATGGSSEFRWGPYVRTCTNCGATDLPAGFNHCGSCGSELK
jgi:enoyl-CoA hydratase/carnithine racemase